MAKLKEYFKEKMAGPPNAIALQRIVVFNLIYYMAWRGRENLRNMKTNTFKVAVDHDGHHYVFQAIKEQVKNHTEKDYMASNEARMYEMPGKIHIKLYTTHFT